MAIDNSKEYILNQLSLCNFYLKNTSKAIYYNELLLSKFPNNSIALHNQKYYNSLIKNS